MYKEPVIEVIKPKEVVKREVVEPGRKIEERLEELKEILRVKKLCLWFSAIPLGASILLFIFSYWLYLSTEIIQLVPEKFSIATGYNLTSWLAILWLSVAVIALVYSKVSKEPSIHKLAMWIGALALFTGLLYICLGYWLSVSIEIYTGTFAPYNIAFSTGILSIVASLLILALKYRMKVKAKFL